MYKILLDDNFYRNTMEQNAYLDKLFDIINQYFDVDIKIVLFEHFFQSRKSYSLAYMSQIINKKILKTERADKYDLNEVVEESDTVLENMGFSKTFIGKVNYIKSQNPDTLIIIPLIYSKKHRKLSLKKYDRYIFFIGNYDEEVESNIAEWVKNNNLIHIPQPSFANKFPANDLCDGYDKWRSEILMSSYTEDKISDLTQIGHEVATRNHYTYDSRLSALNKQKAKPDRNGERPKRHVFKNEAKDVYLSIDFLHGGFEVYDKNAHHQGQFKFNGDFEKNPDENSHPLYLK